MITYSIYNAIKKHTSIDRIDKFIYFVKIITLETIRFNLINFEWYKDSDNDDDDDDDEMMI